MKRYRGNWRFLAVGALRHFLGEEMRFFWDNSVILLCPL